MFNFYPFFPFFQKRVWKTNSEPKIELFYFEGEERQVPYVTSYNNKLEEKFKSVDRDNEIYKYVLKEFEKYPRSPLGGECFAAAIAYLDSQKLREKGVSFTNEDFKNYALAEYIVQYFQFKAFGYKYFSLFVDYIYKKGCCFASYTETSELQRIRSKIRLFTGNDSIVQFFIQEERNYKYSEKSLSDEFSRENGPTEIVKSKFYCLFAKNLEEETERKNKEKITELKEKNDHLTEELENQKIQSENENENLLTQVQELSQKITETKEELIQTKQELETVKTQEADKIKKLQQKLNHQLSWKTKIKHAIIGSLIALGGRESYHYYQKNNLTPLNHNNSTWLDKVYTNIPFNEPEYKNLTNLFRLPQEEKAQNNLAKINQILFPQPINNPNLETEITRLKISDLILQIPIKKSELEKTITNTKSKLNKAENYLLEQLLTEKPNSQKQTELQAILADHKAEITNILTKQQALNNLQKHLEHLKTNQLEAKQEVPLRNG